ncbi:MAG: hypothetical protein KAU35_03320 [candidate division Zixibacteria bacterium]|nr:hypothetical protein [candidate division Zixibacteria bacterium]
MMTYFEVKQRLGILGKFRRLYAEYLTFVNREGNVAAQIVREKMEPLTSIAVDSLRRVDLGEMLTKDAPARGGRKIRINLIRAIFRDHIIRHYVLDEQAPLKVLDQGIVRYRSLLWKQTVHLFNPFFWLYHYTGFVARLPLLLFRHAGYDVDAAERLYSMRVFIVLFQVVFYYVLLRSLGVFDWFWRNLL